MTELINNSDITQDEDSMNTKHSGPFSTEGELSARDDENQISMHLGDVNTTGMKVRLSVYGNDLRIKFPTKMGNVFSFLFWNGDPKIIIGPQCKIYNLS